jgi:predicted DNA-binding WGR domain protein
MPDSIQLRYIDGRHYKFWRSTLDGTTVTVQFGRIGTQGQTQVKQFPSQGAARQAYVNKANEKLGKGYVHDDDAPPAPSFAPPTAPATPAPAAPATPDESADALAALLQDELANPTVRVNVVTEAVIEYRAIAEAADHNPNLRLRLPALERQLGEAMTRMRQQRW